MNTALIRTLAIYAIILPLAVFIGWILSGDMTRTNFSILAAIVFLLLLPAILKWHYAVMILAWNSAITVFYLPGQPPFWMVMAGITFGVALLNRIIEKRPVFISAPSVTIPLLVLLGVVILTGKLRGGFGVQVFGGQSHGGKAYYLIFAAVLGYFAFVSRAIPRERVKLLLALFFLPGLLGIVSHIVYKLGPSFYILYSIIPAGFAGVQAMSEGSGMTRAGGFWVASAAITNYMMAVYGIRKLFQQWHLGLLVLLAVGMGTYGGYRSVVVFFAVTFLIIFFLEGLLRSPIFPALVLVGALGLAFLIPFAKNLPLPVQRTLSVLPIEISPFARADAQGSVEWRVLMWRAVAPELPKYVWLGKGLALNPTDVYLTQEAMRRNRAPNYAGAQLAGDYHSGPLSVYIPFGGLGAVAFLAFIFGAGRACYMNYAYGPQELKIPNRFLYAFFITKVIFFFAVFGSMFSDLSQFVAVVGMSIAINNGVAQRVPAAAASMPLPRLLRFRNA